MKLHLNQESLVEITKNLCELLQKHFNMKRGGLLLSILVLPLYIPTLIFGAEAARRGIEGFETQTSILLLLGVSLLSWAILPFAAASVLKINLR